MADAEEKRRELELAARCGREADIFLDSDFWKKFLEPYLLKEQSTCDEAARWSPAKMTGKDASPIDKCAMDAAYYGGGAQAIGRIATRLTIWIAEGLEAQEELDALDAAQAKKKPGGGER